MREPTALTRTASLLVVASAFRFTRLSPACSYPWWPSLVLVRRDERIPQSEWRNTQTATPVLFFGTAEFSWIDASRNVSPWETDKVARVVKDKSLEFKRVRMA